MLGEIDKDFYCSANFMSNTYIRKCYISTGGGQYCPIYCPTYHRKWPTLEQFKEKYGIEIPDDFPVWFISPGDKNDNLHDWTLMVYAEALKYEEEAYFLPSMCIVCACTPFGKPDKNWRP